MDISISLLGRALAVVRRWESGLAGGQYPVFGIIGTKGLGGQLAARPPGKGFKAEPWILKGWP